MEIKLLRRALVVGAAIFMSVPAMAQNPSIEGVIVDADEQTPLIGAIITNPTTGDVAVTNNDGAFQMRSRAGEQSLKITYMGYLDKEMKLTVSGAKTDAGTIELEPNAIAMAGVAVSASIVTNDRSTPVAVSNITKTEIDSKLSNQEIPMLLNTTPSVYATQENGGWGDGRIIIRGFDSENIGYLINGIPANDMENGKFYWSNWGLKDVMSFMQVQRGLGASKMAISSVGGTINIVTPSTDVKQGGSVYYGIGNDGYQKLSLKVSSGLMDNGWAFTIMGGREKGDGYVDGLAFEQWTYFANISKIFGGHKQHTLSLTAFGSPQWHNQRGNPYMIEDYRRNENGRRMNLTYGMLNGKPTGASYGYNHYHKPIISLVHTWKIDDKSSLTSSVYASIARGGGQRAFGPGGSASHLLSINYDTGRPYPGETLMTPDGMMDYDAAIALNGANKANGAQVILGDALNQHNWYGATSTYTGKFNDFTLTAGFDGRYYTALHANKVVDLLGADYYSDAKVDPETGDIVSSLAYRDPNTQLHKGDIFGYDETSQVLWAGFFAQGEYTKNNFSAFLSASLTGEFYRWHNDGMSYADGGGTSPWVSFAPWSVKAGASYKFAENHNVFVNGGYFTRAPFFNNVFKNYTREVNDKAISEKIGTVEVGYGFSNNVLNITLDGYYTVWLDKGMIRTMGNDQIANIPGINARHMGLELEATYRPSTKFELHAMGSLGDWIWRDDVNADIYDSEQNFIGNTSLYLGGVHVGNSAQMTASLGADWEPFKNLHIGGVINWFGKNYADFDIENRNMASDKVDAWQLPDYYTINLSLDYGFNLGKVHATVYANVNNLLDDWYITDARDGAKHDAYTALVYYGFGRTWTTGIRFNF